jgi:hypothetical protein
MLAIGIALRTDNRVPRPSVDAIDQQPDTDNGDEPIAGMTEMLPQFSKADIEGEQHDQAGQYTDDKEQVVELLLSPFHG